MEMYRSGRNEADSKSVDGSNRPGVRIPPSPPNKDRYFDTKRVEVTVFSFTQKTAQNKAFQRYCRKSRDPAGRNFRSGVVLICGFRCSDAPSNR